MERFYVCYCLLESTLGGRQMSRRLFELQDYYEEKAPGNVLQAFVYGDKEAVCKPFKKYPAGMHAGIEDISRRVLPEDLLTLSWRLLEGAIRADRSASFELVILADYTIEEETEGLELAKELLRSLTGSKLEIRFAACLPGVESGTLSTLTSTEIHAGQMVKTVLGGR